MNMTYDDLIDVLKAVMDEYPQNISKSEVMDILTEIVGCNDWLKIRKTAI